MRVQVTLHVKSLVYLLVATTVDQMFVRIEVRTDCALQTLLMLTKDKLHVKFRVYM